MDSKYTNNAFATGARLGPRYGSLQRSKKDPVVRFEGPLGRGEDNEGREGD